MTASSISVPTTTTAELATDEIDDRHFQGVKVYGGGEGVANELAVQTNGSTADGVILTGFFAMVADAAQSDYSEGDVLGSPLYLGRIPQGLYENVTTLLFDAGGDPPTHDLIVIPVSATPDGDPAATLPTAPGADGAPLGIPLPELSQLLLFRSADADPLPYTGGVLHQRTEPDRLYVFSGDQEPGDVNLVDLWGILVASEDVPVADYSAGLFAATTLRRIPTVFMTAHYTP